MDLSTTSPQRQPRFSDFLPTGESRKAIGIFLRAARKATDPEEVVERVTNWARADWTDAQKKGELADMDRLQRLGKAIKEHRASAVNLAAWAIKHQTETLA